MKGKTTTTYLICRGGQCSHLQDGTMMLEQIMLLDARYGSHIDYMLLQNTQPPGLSKGNYSKPGGCIIMPAW